MMNRRGALNSGANVGYISRRIVMEPSGNASALAVESYRDYLLLLARLKQPLDLPG
jgi:hypothetical protein